MNRGDAEKSRVIMIVAHPDDETLWAGGTLLRLEGADCFILSLCRGSDPDRSPKFQKALKKLGARGTMADLDDGPEQSPLDSEILRNTILEHLPRRRADLIYTHSPLGEYTRHRRHEETGREVLKLWLDGSLQAGEIRLFAYDDAGKTKLPAAIASAPLQYGLSRDIQEKKYAIITETYGFSADSYEARTTPRTEAFWRITKPEEALLWLQKDREK